MTAPWPQEKRDDLARRWRAGEFVPAIGVALGCSEVIVRKHARKQGLTLADRPQGFMAYALASNRESRGLPSPMPRARRSFPPPETPVKPADLQWWHCRYPYGDPGETGFGFCGRRKKPGSSYCPECHARCHIAHGSQAEKRALASIGVMAKGSQGASSHMVMAA